jgi:hypothetical protein
MTRKRFEYLSYAIIAAAVVIVGCSSHGAAPAPPISPQPNATQAPNGTPPPHCPSCAFQERLLSLKPDAPADTTVDECTAPYCTQAIVGNPNQAYVDSWFWQGPPNPYPGYTYKCTVQSWSGTGMTGVFVPATKTVPSPAPYAYQCDLYVKIASNVPIGSYQTYVWQISIYDAHGHNIGGGSFDTSQQPPSQRSDVQGACSNNLNTCPKLEILRGSPPAVISSPKPTPTAVVGEQQVLTMQQVPNSGKTGPYTLSGSAWFVPAQAIKDYPLPSTAPSNAPTPVPLTVPDLLGTTLTYYMTDPTQATNIQAQATLTSSTETAVVNAYAAFGLHAPPMSWTTVTNPVRVSPYPWPVPTGTPELVESISIGEPVGSQAGITWTIKAPAPPPTPLPGVSGNMDMIQVIDINESDVPNGCESTVTMSGNELDTDLWYGNIPAASIAGTWTADDSPATKLYGQPPATPPSTCTSFTRSDSFVDYLMFQSSKPKSIWTPIMQLTWKWSGTAGFSLPNGWVLTAKNGAGSPTGSPSYLFPQWTGRFGN